jgi:hypothetical protein
MSRAWAASSGGVPDRTLVPARPVVVTIDSDSRQTVVTVASKDWQYTTVPLSPGLLAWIRARQRVDIHVTPWFVPAVVDPRSADIRRLGVELRIVGLRGRSLATSSTRDRVLTCAGIVTHAASICSQPRLSHDVSVRRESAAAPTSEQRQAERRRDAIVNRIRTTALEAVAARRPVERRVLPGRAIRFGEVDGTAVVLRRRVPPVLGRREPRDDAIEVRVGCRRLVREVREVCVRPDVTVSR